MVLLVVIWDITDMDGVEEVVQQNIILLIEIISRILQAEIMITQVMLLHRHM